MEKRFVPKDEANMYSDTMDLVKTLAITPEVQDAKKRLAKLGLDETKYLVAWQDSHSSIELAIKKTWPKWKSWKKISPGFAVS